MDETKEPQYSILYDVEEKHGRSVFGIMANESWNNDPKRTLFTLARYKFVARMLEGKQNALEIGCADAFGTRLVQQTVKDVHVIDFDPVFIRDINVRYDKYWPFTYEQWDILERPTTKQFESCFALDVLEHIKKEHEELFFKNIKGSLQEKGIAIFGMPSLESQKHASPQSKEGHVNCQSGYELKNNLQKQFEQVFLFSMNDEMVHTGYYPMAHYLLALCCNPIN